MIGIGSNLAYQPAVSHYSSGARLRFDFKNGSTHPVEGNAALYVSRPLDTGTRFNSSGIIETVAANTARLTHDPAVLRFENLWTWSVSFGAYPVWAKGTGLSSFFTATDNAKIGPTGLLDATKFESTATTSQGLFLRTNQSQVAGAYNTSIHIYMPTQAGVTSWSVIFDAQDAESATTALQTVFDSWVRVDAPITFAATRTFLDFNIRYNGSTAPTTAGFVFYASRAQLNTGPTALEYQRTGATAFAKWYACKGLLAEDVRQNVTRNAECAGNGTAASAGTATGPDGVAATKVVPFAGAAAFAGSGTTTTQFFTIATTAGQTSDFSFSGYFAPYGPKNYKPYIVISAAAPTPTLYALVLFDPTAGTFSSKTLDAGWSEVSAPTAVLHPCGMWFVTWTVRFTQPALLRTNIAHYHQIWNELNQNTYTADGLSGIQRSCHQFEKDGVSSYIPTTTAAVTRNADVPIVAVISPWFNPVEGTMVVGGTVDALGSTSRYPAASRFDNGLNTNVIGAFIADPTTDSLMMKVSDGGVVQTQSAAAVVVAGTPFRYALAYKENDFAMSQNGAAVITDTAGSVPAVTRLLIGSGDYPLGGVISDFTYFGVRKSNADLQLLAA